MHQRITILRHLLLTLGLVAAQACSQRPAELPAPRAAASTSLSISEAQGWYLQTTPAARLAAGTASARRATADASGATSARLLWQRAHTLGQGRQQVVLVPFAGDAGLFARTPYVGVRCLVIGKPTGSTLAGNIVEVLLRRTPEPVDTLGLLTRLYHSYQGGGLAAPGQGEGYVLVYSAGYAYLTGRRFAQGQWLPGTTRLAFQPRAGAATKGGSGTAGAGQRAPSVGEPCLDWYSGETGKYITTTGDCNGLGSGGGGEAPPVYTGGGGPCGGSCGGALGPGGYGGGGGGGTTGDTAELRQFEQDYRAQMSQSELIIFDRLTRAQQIAYLINARDAINRARAKFASFTWHNGPGDAFRHAYFVANNTRNPYLGSKLAKELADAHEQDPNQSAQESEMDSFNNYAGMLIGLDGFSQDIEATVYYWLLAGRLKIIENGQVVYSH